MTEQGEHQTEHQTEQAKPAPALRPNRANRLSRAYTRERFFTTRDSLNLFRACFFSHAYIYGVRPVRPRRFKELRLFCLFGLVFGLVFGLLN